MPITQQSLSHEFTVSEVQRVIDIDTYINVLKRREEIVYRSSLPTGSANVAFVGGNDISSTDNLSIADRSTSLIANRVIVQSSTLISASKTFTINTENFVVTDVFATATETITENPLYYKHTLRSDLVPRDANDDLDTGVTISEIQILDTFLQAVKVSEISIDYTSGIIYNNLAPEFVSSGNYSTYYVKYTVNNSGVATTHIDLLNNTKVYTVADFSDLDGTLQIKTDGRKVYLIEDTGGEYEITLPIDNTYAFKPLSTSRIEIVAPAPSGSNDSWFVRVSNGKLFTQVNGVVYKYHIAEFLNQSFYPEPPIKSVGSESSSILSKTLIKLDHQNIYEEIAQSLYVNIVISKSDGTGVAAFTTNPDIVGDEASNGILWTQWSNTTRYGIKSIDHQTGFVDIDGLALDTTYSATSSYYYSEDKYEFTLINFNPISNTNLLSQKTVLFIDPDTLATSKSQTLFYLKVDETGKVIESNWLGFDNTTQTILGGTTTVYYETFPSWKPTETHVIFTTNYTVEGNGVYLILGDITVAPAGSPAELSKIDSRRRGGGIADTSLDTIRETNPEIMWLWDEGHWDGVPYPGNASYMVEVPVDIFLGSDGVFTQQEVKDIVNRHTAAGVYPVVKAYGVDITVSGVYPSGDSITVEWSGNEY